MRLSLQQQDRVPQVVADRIGDDARVPACGSRIDDQERGGDVDLFLEVAGSVWLMERAGSELAPEQQLSLPVDIVIHDAGKPFGPFQATAKACAGPLEQCTG